MRLRSGLGAGLVAVAVVAAVAVLRVHSVPAPPDSPTPAPPPGMDFRAVNLTADFRHTTLLPATVRFADDPHTPPGFVFERTIQREFDRIVVRYTATGLLVRTKDKAVLDQVKVIVARSDARHVDSAGLVRCDADENGGSCIQATLPHGIAAIVLHDPVTARTDATANLRTELEAVYPNGTQLTITLNSLPQAGIPLDDAAMLKLATIPGISG